MDLTMPPSSRETTFAEATAVKALSSHTYEADFPEDWCIGTESGIHLTLHKVPHGGFVTSVFLQIATAHFKSTLSSQKQPHTIGLHLDFLRRTQKGPAIFTVSDTKLGRQTSIIHISLSQDNREEVVGSLTQSNLATEAGVSLDTGFAFHPPALPVDLKKLKEDKDEHWERAGEMPFASFRKATTKTQFHLPRTMPEVWSWSDEWIRLANGEKWTNESLGYVIDMFRMPVESHRQLEAAHEKSSGSSEGGKKRTYWYPTVLLNMDVKKALPEEGVEWLFSRTTSKQVRNGRMDIEVVVCDGEGEIVALSHHIALAVDASRNTAKRNTKTGESKI